MPRTECGMGGGECGRTWCVSGERERACNSGCLGRLDAGRDREGRLEGGVKRNGLGAAGSGNRVVCKSESNERDLDRVGRERGSEF